MRIRILGGWEVEHDGRAVEIVGDRQRALLFRLALDPHTHVPYRAIAEDLWPDDLPENPRASLQSLVSRLRSQLPTDVVASTPGGYRLELPREAVDAVRFQDLVAAAVASSDAADSARLASQALELWRGSPWTPDPCYDWLERDLARDLGDARERAERPRTASAVPSPLTDIVGRTSELEQIDQQLGLSRLVTILGPGGAGKTRLALEAGRKRGSAIVVELAPAGPDEVPQAVLGAIGRGLRGTQPESPSASTATVTDRIIDALGGRELLLVLDNCEHVIDTAAALAQELLAGEPRLRILATSREPLGIPGEAFVPLGPLGDADAERLFADRVRAARGHAPTDEESEAAARIRNRLDGLPLALELAAAKARTLTLDELAVGLDDRFALLSGGVRTALPRHQTLRALVDWSWSLLTDAERELLQVVSIYPAGVAVGDATEVAAAHDIPRATFDGLVDKSLLYRADGRYRTLETIREYGLERLGESGELGRRRREQADWLAVAVTRADARLRGPEVQSAIYWLDSEDDNIAALLRFAIGSGLNEQAVRIVASSVWYWIIRDRNEDALGWMALVGPLADGVEGDAGLIVRAARSMLRAFGGTGEPSAAIDASSIQEEMEGIAALAAVSGNDVLQVLPPLMAAFSQWIVAGGEPMSMVLPKDDAGQLRPWPRAMLSAMRAALAHNAGELAELDASSRLAIELFSDIGDQWGLALAWQMRSQWLAFTGSLDEALDFADRSTEALRAITSSRDLQQQQGLAVMLLFSLGREAEARSRAASLIAEAEAAGSSTAMVLALVCSAQLELARHNREAAAGHLDRALAAAGDWDTPPPQMTAILEGVHARVELAFHRVVEALEPLARAATVAASSSDNPIMASIAIVIGELSLAVGDPAGALESLALARALRGGADLSDPFERDLEAAIQAAPPRSEERDGAAARAAEEAERMRQILRR
ncbi:NB-ARC domain-containing protein [Homoserinibacter sp. GY 40078]|uniref:ATP-binding protein n=1 Tax=Homoserinibacter sp. GY 40078 TaxID=2603275 RepID=UPI0011C73E71|nr:NB-ARC domain-containing protein [Homoserinibacter sp. GY 40078]TXK17751.1 ATPase [Homoserinibacter sp. GY 40078]